MKPNIKFTLILIGSICVTFLLYYYGRLGQVEKITNYLNDIDKLDPLENKIKTIKQFHDTLKQSDKKHYSQNGEDGVLVKLVEYINKTNGGEYVEFGTGNGDETNTRLLREKYEWHGLLMDGYERLNDNPRINLHIETISHQNIVDLFEKVLCLKFLLFIRA
jgi:hypothetical protein